MMLGEKLAVCRPLLACTIFDGFIDSVCDSIIERGLNKDCGLLVCSICMYCARVHSLPAGVSAGKEGAVSFGSTAHNSSF